MLCFMANIQWNDAGWQRWVMQCTQPSSLVHCLHSIISDSSVLQGGQTFIIVYLHTGGARQSIYLSTHRSVHPSFRLLYKKPIAGTRLSCFPALESKSVEFKILKKCEDFKGQMGIEMSCWWCNRNLNSYRRYLKRKLKKLFCLLFNLQDQCVTCTDIYWHGMELKIYIFVLSYKMSKALKYNIFC